MIPTATPPRLRVLVVAGDPNESRFAGRVLEDHGDEVRVARDVPDALGKLARETVDMALVSLSLPRGDGLALVHHLRALYPELDVVVMAGNAEMEETAHAMALGVLANVMRPLTGDALLVAADRARERRMLISERARLAQEEATVRHRTATYSRCAAFVAETDATVVASRVLDACLAEIPSKHAAIYIPQFPGDPRMMKIGATDELGPLAEELQSGDLNYHDPTDPIQQEGERLRLVLLGDAEVEAVVDMIPHDPDEVGAEAHQALKVIAALGTASLTAARKVDAIARTGVKDPETSAYTFAYFGDVAGREIDRAARHGRRFALLILTVDGMDTVRGRLQSEARMRLRRAMADALLDAVRDSDVLARVEDDEFYLLLPETGMLGALACRRRIRNRFATNPEIQEIAGTGELDPVVGMSVYPTDGGDLGRLLRVGRRRVDRSRRGVWRQLELGSMPFWTAIETLLGNEGEATLAEDGTLSLSETLQRAHDDAGLTRHAALPADVIPQLGATLADDTLRHRVSGTMYVAGDDELASKVARVVDVPGAPSLRAWILGGPEGPGGRNRLAVDDPRLDRRVLLLSLTELGGYVLAARSLRPGTLLAYHGSDLDLVDGLVSSLQSVYHLQPEVT
jgi:diguanylate cyclase (GGDEF)-like protein